MQSEMSFISVISTAEAITDALIVSELSRMQIKAQAMIAQMKQTGRRAAMNLRNGKADMAAP